LNLSKSSIGEQRAQLILVIDALNSSLIEVTKSEEAVEAYLGEQVGQLKMPTTILVVSDSESGATSHPPTAPKNTNTDMHHRELFVHRIPASIDGSILIKSLKDYKAGPHRILDSQGNLVQGERVRLSLEALSFIANAQSSIAGPKLVIWMSPGWPFLARSNAKSSEQLFDSVIYFSNLLRTSRMIVYSVSPEGVTAKNTSSSMSDFYTTSQPASVRALGHAPEIPVEFGYDSYSEFLKGVRSAKQSNPNDLALQVLAYQSGGLVLQNNNDLVDMIRQCAADRTTLYNLSYNPASSGGSDRYHEIEVILKPSTQRLRTRTGLYVK
jgi:VWFA-related protein